MDERWQAEYIAHRYLQHLSDKQLHRRQRDIIRNFITINGQERAAPLPPNHPMHGYWRIRLNHLVEEFRLRFGPYPAGFRSTPGDLYFPNPRSARRVAGCAAVAGRTFEDGKFLFKFGKAMHLKGTLEEGIILISPAAIYDDITLGPAIADDELTMEYWIHEPTPSSVAQLISHSLPQQLPEGAAVINWSSENAWLYCLSATYDPAIYDDFPEYDSCLIIHDPVEFVERLRWAGHHALHARGHKFSAVTYVDPLTQVERDVQILFQKDARYAYQDELRAVWLPPADTSTMERTFAKLGSLETIAELVTLSH